MCLSEIIVPTLSFQPCCIRTESLVTALETANTDLDADEKKIKEFMIDNKDETELCASKSAQRTVRLKVRHPERISVYEGGIIYVGSSCVFPCRDLCFCSS